ncbi:MAG TPA: hypothetical protein VGE55_13145 [Limnobacter sp.]|uniref:hypothetical protein n=1 Tax=Limnobacter sp. TaxID=2003368 RepID=UPI002EDAA980
MTEYDQLMKIKRLQEQMALARLNKAKDESGRLQRELREEQNKEDRSKLLREQIRLQSLDKLRAGGTHRESLIQHQTLTRSHAQEASLAQDTINNLGNKHHVSLLTQIQLNEIWGVRRKSLEKFDGLKTEILAALRNIHGY